MLLAGKAGLNKHGRAIPEGTKLRLRGPRGLDLEFTTCLNPRTGTSGPPNSFVTFGKEGIKAMAKSGKSFPGKEQKKAVVREMDNLYFFTGWAGAIVAQTSPPDCSYRLDQV